MLALWWSMKGRFLKKELEQNFNEIFFEKGKTQPLHQLMHTAFY
jgi:hypothetical protein